MSQADRFPLPKEAWYIGAASIRLGDAPLAIVIHGEAIVLFRNAQGAAAALQDRCPHRGVALSLGKVEGDTLACPYHGWRFDEGGVCRAIPSLRPDQRIRDVSVRAYPVAEQDGHVWIWTGTGDPPTGPEPIDDFGVFAWIQGAIDMACEAFLPIENNLDVCHAAFTHPNRHPQWFRVQATGFQINTYQIEGAERCLAVRGRGVQLRYTLPDRVVVGSGDAFRMVLHHVPTTPGRCRQHWLFQRERVEAPVAPIWSDNEPEILAQDRLVLESAQRNRESLGAIAERSVEADAPGLAVRRLLSAQGEGMTVPLQHRSIEVMS